jgi:hypothetical protein
MPRRRTGPTKGAKTPRHPCRQFAHRRDLDERRIDGLQTLRSMAARHPGGVGRGAHAASFRRDPACFLHPSAILRAEGEYAVHLRNTLIEDLKRARTIAEGEA